MESERIPVHVEQSEAEQDFSILLTEGTVKSWFLTYQYTLSFEVFTVMAMGSSIFWDVIPSSLMKIKPYFGGTYHPACWPQHAGFMLDLLFDPEDGIYFFLWDIG
ncbi:hypothetical protein B7P43_G06595 [Cryptotermes secundus]|uniref:Uncharacterized protein n=1 Tax=Cryptotermes secundus TaxID=105785 RepID=A0A2J7PLJ1_9NEOP|nr:hypothetical protein B7P43_G06595 [Cryptotermes secundus]